MIDLLPHNREAYEKVATALKTQNKAAVVHATGTGKSYIVGAVSNDYDKVLVVAPNNFVLDETYKVCKDGVVFRTYASVMYDKEYDTNYDLIVLDEFHRSGAEKWGVGIQRLLEANPTAKVLGTSATHIRYLDGMRNMADEIFDGNVVSYLPLKDAIDRGILPNPTYVSSIYTMDDMVANYKRKIVNKKSVNQEELCRKLNGIAHNWENAGGVSAIIRKYFDKDMQRIIVFCSKVNRASEARKWLGKWFGLAGYKKIRFYNIDYTEKRLEREMKDFQEPCEEGQLKVAISVNMLNEGVHIPRVDGVIMLRSTISRIIIEQQVGRCLTADNKGRTPVVLDLVNNMDLIRYDGAEFVSFDEDGNEREHSSESNNGFPFKVIDECRDMRILLEQLDALIAAEYTYDECKIEAEKYTSYNTFRKGSPLYYNCALRHKWRFDHIETDKFINRHNKDEIFAHAKTCSSRKEFRKKYENEYAYIVNHDLLRELDAILPLPYTTWDIDLAKAEAKKYNTRTEFCNSSQGCYMWCCRHNCLDEVCTHMGEYQSIHNWSVEEIESYAKQCKSKAEWRTRGGAFNTSYKVASAMGILNEICERCGLSKRLIFDDTYYLEIAKQYSSSAEMYRKDKKLYSVIHKRGLLLTAFPCARKPTFKTDEELLEIAKDFKTSKELRRENRNVYSMLQRRGLLSKWKEMVNKERQC